MARATSRVYVFLSILAAAFICVVLSRRSSSADAAGLQSPLAMRGVQMPRMAMRGANMHGIGAAGQRANMMNLQTNAALGFLDLDKDLSVLMNDLREGETVEARELEQPNNWDEYNLFVSQTGGPKMEESETPEVMETAPIETTYGLNVLWLEKNIAIAVDEIYPGAKRIPLTTFHLWPQTDAWEDIKSLMEQKSWIKERDMINVLNQATEIINFWQDEKTTADAREKFPDVLIRGTEQAEGTVMDLENVDGLEDGDADGAKDTSAVPRIGLKQAPGFEALFSELSWYRDPELEGPWDDTGKWKDVSITTLEQLQAAVPQKMPGGNKD
eukprot:CAMPEP_0197535350 /NCGR_PEP_ID=MMETSP1318-20131121/50241_1 /TAXON_ID=552666 /ORGANISM="Partenskyella glossopodia, Strain RCC365" /LENGTH=327 /DNA_ID=CAMNT_0043092897 /DNA_START=52 /DNA_END=1035 /DNA_ORIENTATION=+